MRPFKDHVDHSLTLSKDIYIFIDLYGVLNTRMHNLYQQKEYGKSSPARWCPVASNNVYRLCKKYAARIVVTTHFEKEVNANRLRELFEKNGIPGDFVAGCLEAESQKQDYGVPIKGAKIKEWLEKNAPARKSYLILDKEDNLLPDQWDHFVQVDPENGFADPNVMIEAVEILTNFNLNEDSDYLHRIV